MTEFFENFDARVDKRFEQAKEFLSKRKVSRAFLAVSVALVIASPFIPANLSIFKQVDLPKIEIFAYGISPYVSSPWAAPYPPFFFFIWSAIYAFLHRVLGSFNGDAIYFGIRVASAIAILLTSSLVYQSVAKMQRGNLSISLAAIFLAIASVTNLVALNGDSFGLLLVSAGSFFLLYKRTILIGIVFISLAVAFKIHPILGLVLLVASCISISWKTFTKSLAVSTAILLGLLVLPTELLPGGASVVFSYTARTLQYYTFSVYSGVADMISLVAPSSIAPTSYALNVFWIFSTSTVAVVASAFMIRMKLLTFSRPIDIFSLGALIWLLVLKQLLQHYFVWALVPLLASSRWKSSFYLVIGEMGGASLWATGLFLSRGSPLDVPPNAEGGVLFLVASIVFAFWDLMALRRLVAEILQERERRIRGESPLSSSLVP
jgi:hypothetical protein